MNIPIYVINLDKDLDRIAHIKKEMDRQSLSYERVAAVEGGNLTSEQFEFYSTGGRDSLSKCEIGCMLSHIKVWEMIASGRDKFAVVLEDDIHLSRKFSKFLFDFIRKIDDDEVVIHKLETIMATVTMSRRPEYRAAGFTAYKLISNHGGTGAYILSRGSAVWLLEQSSKMRLPIDFELFNPFRRSMPYINVYQWLEPLCIQDVFLERRLETNMTERFEFRRDIPIGAMKFILLLKAKFRPLYVFLYSMILLPKGKFRKTLFWEG